MKPRRILVTGFSVAVLGLVLSGVAWANGGEFFGDKNTKLDLYYFGHIKDLDGKVLDNAVVTITAKNVGLKFPFRNDSPGHFRSPDIGTAIKGLGKTVDPSQMEIVVLKKGYVQDKTVTIPNKTEGGILLNFVMRPAAPPSTN